MMLQVLPFFIYVSGISGQSQVTWSDAQISHQPSSASFSSYSSSYLSYASLSTASHSSHASSYTGSYSYASSSVPSYSSHIPAPTAVPSPEYIAILEAGTTFVEQTLGYKSSEYVIKDYYTSDLTKVTHVYLWQVIDGVEVSDNVINLNIDQDGSIISYGNTFKEPFTDLPTWSSYSTSSSPSSASSYYSSEYSYSSFSYDSAPGTFTFPSSSYESAPTSSYSFSS